MNAAARLVHQNILSRHLLWTRFLSRRNVIVAALALMVLLSALSIIYVTHLSRILHATYQHNLSEQDRLHVERGQLLLERSTWMIQSRVQQIAEEKLGMIIPDSKSVVIIRE
jgi:cell division protein FtsL